MPEITYTNLTENLCKGVYDLLKVCFPDMPAEDQYSLEELIDLARIFSEGTVVALDGSKVIGMGSGVFIDMDFNNMPPTEKDLLYENFTGESKHRFDGEYYYGTDMAVHPNYRGLGIAREIYNRRKALTVKYNRKGFAAVAVIPGYADHRSKLNIKQYIKKVVAGKIFDPTVSVQLRNDFKFIKLIPEFFGFPRSDNWGALILWKNKSYNRRS